MAAVGHRAGASALLMWSAVESVKGTRADVTLWILQSSVVHATAAAGGELAEDESPVAAIIVCVDDVRGKVRA